MLRWYDWLTIHKVRDRTDDDLCGGGGGGGHFIRLSITPQDDDVFLVSSCLRAFLPMYVSRYVFLLFSLFFSPLAPPCACCFQSFHSSPPATLDTAHPAFADHLFLLLFPAQIHTVHQVLVLR